MSEYRAKLLELFDEGNVGKDGIFLDLVNFISESDAKEFWEQYYDVDEDEDYEYDGQPDEAQEWHDFDPDC